MWRERLSEPRRGGDRVIVVVGQRRFVQLTREFRVVIVFGGSCRPIAPAREPALRIGHGSDRVGEPAPIAVPDGCTRLPLQRIVVEIGSGHAIEIAQRFRTAIPRQRERQCQRVAARRRFGQAAGARECIETPHPQIAISARVPCPAREQGLVFDDRRRRGDQCLDLPLRILQQRCPLQHGSCTVRRQERGEFPSEAAVGFLQRHACPLFDELGCQRILRAHPVERAFAVRQAARSQPAFRNERCKIVGALELDARREALAFERVIRKVAAVLIKELLPVTAFGEAGQPHSAQIPADRLALVVRDEGLRALIDRAKFVPCVRERAPDARGLQVRVKRIITQRLAVGMSLRSGIVDFFVGLAERFAHLFERISRLRAARARRRQQRAREQHQNGRYDSSRVHA